MVDCNDQVVELLRRLKLEVRPANWNVRHGAGLLPKPVMGFLFPADMEGALNDGIENLGASLVVVESDPVETHAVDLDRINDKYVVVRWMPPMAEAIGIVDTTDTEFVCFFDFSQLPNKEDLMADQALIFALTTHMQFIANEWNRLNTALVVLMRSNVK